jgi:hypothetical protein
VSLSAAQFAASLPSLTSLRGVLLRLTDLAEYLPEFRIKIRALMCELLHFGIDGIEPIDNRLEAGCGFACEKRT